MEQGENNEARNRGQADAKPGDRSEYETPQAIGCTGTANAGRKVEVRSGNNSEGCEPDEQLNEPTGVDTAPAPSVPQGAHAWLSGEDAC